MASQNAVGIAACVFLVWGGIFFGIGGWSLAGGGALMATAGEKVRRESTSCLANLCRTCCVCGGWCTCLAARCLAKPYCSLCPACPPLRCLIRPLLSTHPARHLGGHIRLHGALAMEGEWTGVARYQLRHEPRGGVRSHGGG